MFILNTNTSGSNPQSSVVKDLAPLEDGIYECTLLSGYVTKRDHPKYDRPKTKICLQFEVPSVKINEVACRSLFLFETLSTNDKSNLHKRFLSKLPRRKRGLKCIGLDDPNDAELNQKYALEGFYLDDRNLFGSKFKIMVEQPKGNAKFNNLLSIKLMEESLQIPA